MPDTGVGGGLGHQPLGCVSKPAAGGTGMHEASVGERGWDQVRVLGWYLRGGFANARVLVNVDSVCVCAHPRCH